MNQKGNRSELQGDEAPKLEVLSFDSCVPPRFWTAVLKGGQEEDTATGQSFAKEHRLCALSHLCASALVACCSQRDHLEHELSSPLSLIDLRWLRFEVSQTAVST